MITTLENLLKSNNNFYKTNEIAKAINLLKLEGKVSISSFYSYFISKGVIELLICLEIVKLKEGKIELVKDLEKEEIHFLILGSLFKILKKEYMLHKFLNEKNLFYEKGEKNFYIKNNLIDLHFASIRNLLIGFDFLQKGRIIKEYFYINPTFNDWFIECIIPDIEIAELKNNSLEQLINQRNLQEEHGAKAEGFVLKYERFQRRNRQKASNIRVVSSLDTSAGYDIKSYMDDNSMFLDKFIEVKSYNINPRFFWSINEIKVAKEKSENYYIYLVDRSKMENKNYHPIKIKNPANRLFDDSNWRHSIDGYLFKKDIS